MPPIITVISPNIRTLSKFKDEWMTVAEANRPSAKADLPEGVVCENFSVYILDE